MRKPPHPPLAGDYAGTLGSLHLRLHIQRGENGALTGTMDSIDQGAFGIPCADVAITGAQFSFSFPRSKEPTKAKSFAGSLTISGI